jgi:beta-glucosidase-like glycosyl hydrolase
MDKEQTIEKHLDLLSIEEKVAQLMVLGLTGTFVEPELIRFIEKYGLGGLRLSPHLARKFVRYLPDGSPGFKNVNRAPSLQEKIFDNSIPPMRITAKEYAEILNDLRKKAFERTKGLPLHMVADFESDGGDFTPPGMISAPAAMGFGDLGDTDLIKRILSAVGRQIKAVGIDWIHSPVADVNVNRNNPEIYTRSYSEDTDKATNCILFLFFMR